MTIAGSRAVCVISGGLDSVVSAFLAKELGKEIVALHFDYSQRTMLKERECFKAILKSLNPIKSYILDANFIATIGANALTDLSLAVPKGGLSGALPITYVPFRNGIFLSIAAALAQKERCAKIYIGVVQEDSSGYPDCTDEFINSMSRSINLGTAENISIETPLIHLSKGEIVKEAIRLNVPLEHTWSCYESNDMACGECDSCRLRLKGFKEADLVDPIKYAKI